MADKVCEKLINGRSWVRHTDANKMPHEEGIYVIGVKRRGQKAVIYLYLGQSIDVHVRLIHNTSVAIKKLTTLLSAIFDGMAEKISALSGLKSLNTRRRRLFISNALRISWVIS